MQQPGPSQIPLGDLINWTEAEYDREALAVDRRLNIHHVLGDSTGTLPLEIAEQKIRRNRYQMLLVRLRELQQERSEN